jgi:hypothetical protein
MECFYDAVDTRRYTLQFDHRRVPISFTGQSEFICQEQVYNSIQCGGTIVILKKMLLRDLSIRPTFHPEYIASGDYFQ